MADDIYDNAMRLIGTQQIQFPNIIKDLINPLILKKDTHWIWYVFPTSKEGNGDTLKTSIFKDEIKDTIKQTQIINNYLEQLFKINHDNTNLLADWIYILATIIYKNNSYFPADDIGRIKFFCKLWLPLVNLVDTTRIGSETEMLYYEILVKLLKTSIDTLNQKFNTKATLKIEYTLEYINIIENLKNLYSNKYINLATPHTHTSPPITKPIITKTSSDFNPGTADIILLKHPSFVNNGVNCYMNAALQLLYSMTDFADKFKVLKESDFSTDTQQNKAITALNFIFSRMDNNLKINLYDSKDKSNKSFRDDLLDLVYTDLRGNISMDRDRQNDPEEFLSLLFTKLLDQEYGNKILIGLNLEQIYHIIINKEYYCNDLTKYINEQKNLLGYIQCSIIDDYGINLHTLQTCFNSYTKLSIYSESNVIDEKCNGIKPKYTRDFFIIPNKNQYIIIQLKRYTSELGIQTKINHSVKPEIELKIISEGDDIHASAIEYTYELVGCILHNGTTTGSGHYVYLKYIDNGNTTKDLNKSIIIDDSHVYNYNNNQQGRDINTQGYIYLYKKSTTILPKKIQKYTIDPNSLPLPLPISQTTHTLQQQQQQQQRLPQTSPQTSPHTASPHTTTPHTASPQTATPHTATSQASPQATSQATSTQATSQTATSKSSTKKSTKKSKKNSKNSSKTQQEVEEPLVSNTLFKTKTGRMKKFWNFITRKKNINSVIVNKKIKPKERSKLRKLWNRIRRKKTKKLNNTNTK